MYCGLIHQSAHFDMKYLLRLKIDEKTILIVIYMVCDCVHSRHVHHFMYTKYVRIIVYVIRLSIFQTVYKCAQRTRSH